MRQRCSTPPFITRGSVYNLVRELLALAVTQYPLAVSVTTHLVLMALVLKALVLVALSGVGGTVRQLETKVYNSTLLKRERLHPARGLVAFAANQSRNCLVTRHAPQWPDSHMCTTQ